MADTRILEAQAALDRLSGTEGDLWVMAALVRYVARLESAAALTHGMLGDVLGAELLVCG